MRTEVTSIYDSLLMTYSEIQTIKIKIQTFLPKISVRELETPLLYCMVPLFWPTPCIQKYNQQR